MINKIYKYDVIIKIFNYLIIPTTPFPHFLWDHFLKQKYELLKNSLLIIRTNIIQYELLKTNIITIRIQ